MKKHIFVYTSSLSLFFTPLFTYAFEIGIGKPTTFADSITYVTDIIYQIIPILILLSFILFFWGLSKFVIGASNEKDLELGKEYMLWGILALFILVSVRSIINIVASDTFGRSGTVAPLLPGGVGGGGDSTTKFSPSSTLPKSE